MCAQDKRKIITKIETLMKEKINTIDEKLSKRVAEDDTSGYGSGSGHGPIDPADTP